MGSRLCPIKFGERRFEKPTIGAAQAAIAAPDGDRERWRYVLEIGEFARRRYRGRRRRRRSFDFPEIIPRT
jgi:hypothetical protein